MANLTQTDQKGIYNEYRNLIVDYSEGGIAFYDHVKDFAAVYPFRPMTNIIAMCSSGEISLKANKTPMVVKAQDVFFCPPNMTISDIVCSDDLECKVLCLSDHVIQGLLHDKINVWNQAVYVNEFCVISMSEVCRSEMEIYYSLIRSKIENHKDAPSSEIVQTIVRALLLELCIILESRHGKTDDSKMSQGRMLFNRFLRLITSNEVKRRPINEYASRLAITPKYLTMLCLKYSDKTASDWIIQYTSEDIRFYLANSNLSIKEISAKLGFANMSHFGSYVRKHLGMSPSDFRHKQNETT